MYQYTHNKNYWEWHKVGNDDIYYCTNTDGEAVFKVNSCRNSRRQLAGTLQFSVYRLTESSAKRKIRNFMKEREEYYESDR